MLDASALPVSFHLRREELGVKKVEGPPGTALTLVVSMAEAASH